MTTDARLPDWPPPDGEAIGEERARAYIAWIRDHAPPLLTEGRRMLQERWELLNNKYYSNVCVAVILNSTR